MRSNYSEEPVFDSENAKSALGFILVVLWIADRLFKWPRRLFKVKIVIRAICAGNIGLDRAGRCSKPHGRIGVYNALAGLQQHL